MPHFRLLEEDVWKRVTFHPVLDTGEDDLPCVSQLRSLIHEKGEIPVKPLQSPGFS